MSKMDMLEAKILYLGQEIQYGTTVGLQDDEIICITLSEVQVEPNKYIWIADSGASHHLTNSPEGLFNVRKVNYNIQIGNGQ